MRKSQVLKIVKISKNKYFSEYFIVKYVLLKHDNNNVFISIGKKIGKANMRNKIKRRIKYCLYQKILNQQIVMFFIILKPMDYLLIKKRIEILISFINNQKLS